jgi:hypothetical protein
MITFNRSDQGGVKSAGWLLSERDVSEVALDHPPNARNRNAIHGGGIAGEPVPIRGRDASVLLYYM